MRQAERGENTQTSNLGYEAPRSPVDDTGRGLLEKYGLPSDASLAQIEQVAKGLLTHGDTLLEGIQLVLGRYVGTSDVKEDYDLTLLFSHALDAELRFLSLASMRSTEDEKRKAEAKTKISND